jgi:hypothetical protein
VISSRVVFIYPITHVHNWVFVSLVLEQTNLSNMLFFWYLHNLSNKHLKSLSDILFSITYIIILYADSRQLFLAQFVIRGMISSTFPCMMRIDKHWSSSFFGSTYYSSSICLECIMKDMSGLYSIADWMKFVISSMSWDSLVDIMKCIFTWGVTWYLSKGNMMYL